MLSGCGSGSTEQGVRTVSDYCLIAKGLSFSRQDGAPEDASNKYDTEQTVKEVEEHNLKWLAVCEKPEG